MDKVYFVGTAGSGKSTMVGAFGEWLSENGIDRAIVNLDPGADDLPYAPDVDIREWIDLDYVMSNYRLGPNGAQIVAADLIAVHVNEILDAVKDCGSDYVLIDTPGQLELFAFRESSTLITNALGKEGSMIAYLSDPMLYKTANGFVSTMILASLVQFRLGLPMINLLSKTDLLEEPESDRIIGWYENPDTLYGDLLDEDSDPQSVMGMELFRALENTGVFGDMRKVSAKEGEGLEEIYGAVQLQFHGGDDAGKGSY